MVELLVAVAIVGITATIAVPQASRALGGMKIRGDARNVANAVTLAKMRSASSASRARVYVSLDSGQFRVQVWNKTTSAWETEGGTQQLAQGVSFGFSGLSTAPPNTQTTIGQSAQCLADDGTAIANTACVVFNSRGIPIDGSLLPTGDNGLYITDGVGVYGTTITATPLVRRWWSPASRVAWVKQ